MSSAASDEETEELVAALSDDLELLEEEEDCAPSPRPPSEETEDDDDELHIAARAGIRLLEENMHFREEVLRLHEQLTHVKEEKQVVEQSLTDRDAQVAALTTHLRETILENQSILSELAQAKDQLRVTQEQLTQLQQQLQQRSPLRRTSHQRLSPRRSTTFSRPLVFDEGEVPSPPMSPMRGIESPPATPVSAEAAIISPTKSGSTGDNDNGVVDRRQSYGETSPTHRRPTLTRLREVEAKYDEEHQRCSSLKLELNFAQRRVSELKPLQGQLEHLNRELEAARSRLAEVETQLTQSQIDHTEAHELIQSLRQTIHAYEQLNDPRNRGGSSDYTTPLQEGSASTAETIDSDPTEHNQHLARLDRAAEMIDGRFDMRDENERLLRQLNTLATRVLELSTCKVIVPDENTPIANVESTISRQRYLEQQVSVLQDLLRRFRLEWQHAHDARVCLEHEKVQLLKQLERQRTTLQRTRSTSVSSRRSSVNSTLPRSTNEGKDSPDDEVPATNDPADNDDDDDEAAHAHRLWEHTNAICEALLRPSPTDSKEEDIDHELLCFALLRRLVDSWTTDKPKRMQLHDWLTNAIRGIGIRKPLYLHELSSEIAMGFQTLMVPILQNKFGVNVSVERRLRNVIVTDLRIHVVIPSVEETTVPSATTAARAQRAYHSLLSVIDGENGVQGSDEYHEWLGNYSIRRAFKGYLSK